jgi:hypothetical protein
VSSGDSSTTFNGARLRRGIVDPQAPAVCSEDVKQQRAQTFAITDHSERTINAQPLLLDVAGERLRLPKCHERPAVPNHINSGAVWPEHGT